MSTGESVKDALSSASRLASYNMVLQLSFRILTFILNAFTLRYISRDALGIVNVRLVLLYSTILFLSREAFRRACLSNSPKNKENGRNYITEWSKMINILWCIVPVGMICTALLTFVWINYLENPNEGAIPYYPISAVLFGASALLELFAEPLWVLAQALLFIKLRVLSEGIAMVLKCISTVVLVIFFPNLGILSFCITQMLFSVVHVLIHYGYFFWYIVSGNFKKNDNFPFSTVKQIFPKCSSFSSAIDVSTAKLTWSFFKQSFLKQILTEGEKYVMTLLNVLSFGDQGVYDVVNNLGSLAARFIFLPIEESFYVFFAKVLERGVGAEKQNKDTILSVRKVLHCLLRLVVLIGSVIFVYGFSFSRTLLHLYGGKMLSEGSGPMLLQVYGFYVLLIAINGTTECFVFAAMSQAEVDRYNKKMLGFSLIFLTSSYYFTWYLGSVGFILANCLNMTVRILHSVYFIYRYFARLGGPSPLNGILPHYKVVATLCIALISGHISKVVSETVGGLVFRTIHVLVGGVLLAATVTVIYMVERDALNFIKEQYFSKSQKKE